jgi:pimeloyl-ACP methyl ester carboxylesterase
MAARFWISVTLAELAIALVMAAIGAKLLHLGLPATSGLTLALLPMVTGAGVACSCAVACGCSAADGGPGAAWQWLRAFITEVAWFNRARVAMMAAPFRPTPPAPSPIGAGTARPVLLIHGFACSAAVWARLSARLQNEGFWPVRAVNLEPLWAGLDSHVAAVAGELASVHQEGRGEAVTVVAHSFGGLVARLVLPTAERGVIRQVLTVGTPHHGTILAHFIASPATRQMRPGSSWLQRLNGLWQPSPGVSFTSLYSRQDNIVAPARSAVLTGVNNVAMSGLGHFGLINSRRALDAICSALARPSLAIVPPS